MGKKKLEEKLMKQMVKPRPREPMMPRPTIFASHKDYDRNRAKQEVRQQIEDEEGLNEP